MEEGWGGVCEGNEMCCHFAKNKRDKTPRPVRGPPHLHTPRRELSLCSMVGWNVSVVEVGSRQV